MAKLMTIILKVEPPAFGPVILKLKEMEGVAELNFDVSDSNAASDPNAPQPRKVNLEEIATALLIKGPAHIKDFRRAFVAAGAKGTASQAYGVMHHLKKKGIAKAGAEKGLIELTAKALKSIKGHEADTIRLLPKPRANGAAKPKRPSPGEGRKALLDALAGGPTQAADIKTKLAELHLSEKSFTGITFRARQDGLVKSNGHGLYELTAKGTKEAASG
jgi:hypothetical protein